MRKQTLALGLMMSIALVAPTALAAPAPASQPAWTNLDLAPARSIPVQYGGRTMPLDTLAREILWQVTGKRSWQGHDPVGLLLAWSWQGQDWLNEPLVMVGFPQLQKQLDLPENQKRFAYAQLSGNPKLMQMFSKPDDSPGNAALQRGAQQIASRLDLLGAAFTGKLLRIVPPAAEDATGTWATSAELATGASDPASATILAAVEKMRSGFLAADTEAFNTGTNDLVLALLERNSPAWPDPALISLEVTYNQWNLFQWGWVLTCLAMVAGLVALATPNKAVKVATWALLIAGFAALTVGIGMRWRFSGHAPLATMYESLIFMGWGVVAIGLVTAAVVRLRAALPIVAGVATAILIVADSSPLDATPAPLVPVLRNTAWLTYHVLTIMLAYSALALAMGVGHVQAALLAYRPGKKDRDAEIGRLLYGMILVGCVFLTAGIIFGAIWANKSWGRYWGWDPKETWSLITLLGYMAVLHGRRIGWFGSFGLATWSILCFLLVIMTYYGVNFVLGSGLHSYGFASGGKIYMALYVLAEIAFVLWMWAAHARTTQPTAEPVARQTTASRR
jgi:ABC-type transport system involved in cytochrome c biogenesis permease subunit